IPALDTLDLPPSSLPQAVMTAIGQVCEITADPVARLAHLRGKSTPDLLRLRAKDTTDAPDAVARPTDHAAALALLQLAAEHRLAVVPFGGGTSVVGGLVADRDTYAGVIAADLSHMTQLLRLDRISRTATFEAGIRAPEA